MNNKIKGNWKLCRCGVRFYVTESIRHQKFCSKHCSLKWQDRRTHKEIKLICVFCGDDYRIPHWREGKSKFCSQRCSILSQQTCDTDLTRIRIIKDGKAQRLSPEVRRARNQFFDHRYSAGIRGIEFLLTFDEWWDIWLKSRHWDERGRIKGQYCMARKADRGPYVVGNVLIKRVEENIAERKMPRGADVHNAKLTEDDVLEIRRLDGKVKRRILAERFGVSYHHVRDIQKCKTKAWSWLK